MRARVRTVALLAATPEPITLAARQRAQEELLTMPAWRVGALPPSVIVFALRARLLVATLESEDEN